MMVYTVLSLYICMGIYSLVIFNSYVVPFCWTLSSLVRTGMLISKFNPSHKWQYQSRHQPHTMSVSVSGMNTPWLPLRAWNSPYILTPDAFWVGSIVELKGERSYIGMEGDVWYVSCRWRCEWCQRCLRASTGVETSCVYLVFIHV